MKPNKLCNERTTKRIKEMNKENKNKEEFEGEFKKYRAERLLKECPMCSDLYHGFKAAWFDQANKYETRIDKLEAILRDFLTTKECKETWIAEMRGTIDDVLNGGE